MREILFRGKCQNGYDYSNGDGWVYGSLLQKDESVVIVRAKDIDFARKLTDDGFTFINDFSCIPVESNSVGQFTGLTDKNGIKVFEGDIIEYNEDGYQYRAIVVFKNGVFYSENNIADEFRISDLNNDTTIKVIGNIHDNNNKKQLWK